jgi:hypothetical protein
MREILTDIFTWPWFSEPHGYNFNGHLICRPGGNLCIDPVEPAKEDLEEMVQRGVAHILITNRNHGRAANAIRERTGARTVIHPADAPHARQEGTVVDGELPVGAKVGPFNVVGAPGKSPGEVVGHPPGHCKLLPDKVVDNPALLRRSVRELLALEFEILLVGDGDPILTSAKDRLRELVDSW